MPIVEKYKDNGTVIGGKIESGKVTKGQSILIMPTKKVAEVVSIFYEETELTAGYCGDNIKIKLKGIEEEDIFPGNVACDLERPVKSGTKLRVQVAILNCKNIISSGYKAVLHVQMCSEEIIFLVYTFFSLQLLNFFSQSFVSFMDKKTGQKLPKRPFAREGDVVEAIIEASSSICIECFKDHPQLGRFSLRDEGKTVAMGKILEIIS